MSRPRSSKFAALAAFALLPACAHQTTATDAQASLAPGGTVGYVRMDELLKRHPLYPQLAHLDDDVAALQLKSVGPDVALAGAGVAAETRALQRELDDAARRTKAVLADKQQQYAKREQAAIDEALRAASGVGGPSGGAIAGGVAGEARVQSQAARTAAQANFDAYRAQLIAQDRRAVETLDHTLAQRADREYRARAERFQRAESDAALELASADAAERLSLRTKLSNLALDDASRADVKAQLDALDRKEGDAIGALKNRDGATLLVFEKDLRARVRTELGEQVRTIRSRTLAKINARALDARRSLETQMAQLPPIAGGAGVAGVPPGMRAKLQTLHAKFQRDFNADATKTIAQFQATRSDLTRRFQALSGVDARAQQSAGREIDALQRQRGDLYGEMVAQIDREVKSVAQRRGIGIVVKNTVAPAGGTDLTADAEKEIESLHE